MATATTQEQRIGTTLRALREARRLSLRTLASRAGFSPSFISQVENGQTSASIASLERIASALGVTLADFFEPTVDTATIARAAKRSAFTSTWSNAELAMLSTGGQSRLLDSILLTLAPGGRSGSQPVAHQGEEFAFVLEGAARLTLDGVLHELEANDAVTFRSDAAHLWENTGADPARIIIVTTRHPDAGPSRR